MKRHQRIWLWGELKDIPGLEHQKRTIGDRINRYQGDLARMTSPGMDPTREKIKGGASPSPEIQYMSTVEKIERLQLQLKNIESKLEYLTSCMKTLPDPQRMILTLEIQNEVPRFRTIEELEHEFGKRYHPKQIQRMKSDAQEQLLKLLLGVMA